MPERKNYFHILPVVRSERKTNIGQKISHRWCRSSLSRVSFLVIVWPLCVKYSDHFDLLKQSVVACYVAYCYNLVHVLHKMSLRVRAH